MFKIILCSCLLVCSIYSCKNLSSVKKLDPVTEKPAIEQLIGVYMADENTKRTTNGYGEKINSFFKLNKDGMLEYNQIPISTLDFSEYFKNNHALISGLGQWEISDQGGFIELNFVFNINDSTIWNTSSTLGKKSKKYVFYSLVGDPNKNISATFIQQ